ncbi:phosphatidylserine decarboxylase family protein [Candidatus Woesearchaeota archaeon]|nr:phosphatidylserine decarboxylase family protein [Candidatus Woesearchaeota archaeon]
MKTAILILVAMALITASVFMLWRIFLAFFNRNPKRRINRGEHLLAPADGKVISILRLDGQERLRLKKKYLGKIELMVSDIIGRGKGYMVSIFMSPLDVHINRYPISGRVESIKYKTGKFLVVNNLKNSLENEKNEIIIKTGRSKIKVVQIAGFLARNIVCNAQPGKNAMQGEIFGRINLGSQAVLVFPDMINGKKLNIKVRKGQKVKAGLDIIATIG